MIEWGDLVPEIGTEVVIRRTFCRTCEFQQEKKGRDAHNRRMGFYVGFICVVYVTSDNALTEMCAHYFTAKVIRK